MSYRRQLLEHMSYHNVKQWLIDGARREGAQTIGRALENIPERRLIRRLARALAQDGRYADS
jgi:hypothetical protein